MKKILNTIFLATFLFAAACSDGYDDTRIKKDLDDVGQILDELEQVIDLLELAPRVLVELALAGEDVQRLEQFQALTGPQAKLGGHVLLRGSGRFGRFIFLHSGCSGCGR